MTQIEEAARLDASVERVQAALSPEAIVRYEGTYTVESTRTTDGERVLTVSSPHGRTNAIVDLAFHETADGYVYEQRGRGLFAELRTEIDLADADGGTLVTITSRYTFGGLFAPVKDWFTTTSRREELRRFLTNLAAEVADERPDEG